MGGKAQPLSLILTMLCSPNSNSIPLVKLGISSSYQLNQVLGGNVVFNIDITFHLVLMGKNGKKYHLVFLVSLGFL